MTAEQQMMNAKQQKELMAAQQQLMNAKQQLGNWRNGRGGEDHRTREDDAVFAVIGAPYAADEITTFTQMLGDGTRIQREDKATVYRDRPGPDQA